MSRRRSVPPRYKGAKSDAAMLVVEACGGAPMISAELPARETGIGFDEVMFEAFEH